MPEPARTAEDVQAQRPLVGLLYRETEHGWSPQAELTEGKNVRLFELQKRAAYPAGTYRLDRVGADGDLVSIEFEVVKPESRRAASRPGTVDQATIDAERAAAVRKAEEEWNRTKSRLQERIEELNQQLTDADREAARLRRAGRESDIEVREAVIEERERLEAEMRRTIAAHKERQRELTAKIDRLEREKWERDMIERLSGAKPKGSLVETLTGAVAEHGPRLLPFLMQAAGLPAGASPEQLGQLMQAAQVATAPAAPKQDPAPLPAPLFDYDPEPLPDHEMDDVDLVEAFERETGLPAPALDPDLGHPFPHSAGDGHAGPAPDAGLAGVALAPAPDVVTSSDSPLTGLVASLASQYFRGELPKEALSDAVRGYLAQNPAPGLDAVPPIAERVLNLAAAYKVGPDAVADVLEPVTSRATGMAKKALKLPAGQVLTMAAALTGYEPAPDARRLLVAALEALQAR